MRCKLPIIVCYYIAIIICLNSAVFFSQIVLTYFLSFFLFFWLILFRGNNYFHHHCKWYSTPPTPSLWLINWKAVADNLWLLAHSPASPGKDRSCKKINFYHNRLIEKVKASLLWTGSVNGREGCQPHLQGLSGQVSWKQSQEAGSSSSKRFAPAVGTVLPSLLNSCSVDGPRWWVLPLMPEVKVKAKEENRLESLLHSPLPALELDTLALCFFTPVAAKFHRDLQLT